MKEAKLLNCPFCCGESELDCDNGFNNWFVKCKECGCKTPTKIAEYVAIEAWNTRKPMEGIIDYLEEFMEKQYDSYNNAKRTGNIRQMDYSDGCAEGLIEAIEIVKEEGGIE